MKDWFKGKDLNMVLYSWGVDPNKLTESDRKKLGLGEYDFEGWIMLNGGDIEELDSESYEAVDWDDLESEIWCNPDYADNFIKKAPAYLVWASGCRWDGASGYKFATDFEKAVHRDYENTQYIERQSKGRKVLYVSEHSHDVPMGGSTKYIALTDREYQWLQDADWEAVESFASQF